MNPNNYFLTISLFPMNTPDNKEPGTEEKINPAKAAAQQKRSTLKK